ncbi:MAG: hypothetical protein MUF25_06755 [Pirellulaceae bacterium]|nr:hypothetical protein [Pirellulaceae bacterium]
MHIACTLLLTLALLGCHQLCFAAESPPTADAQAAHAAEAQTLTTGEAKKWDFHLEAGTSLELQPNAVLRWSNPIVGEIYGNVFVWTSQGRPEMIGSIYKWYAPFTHMSAEFHSLAVGPLTGKRAGQPVWSPARGGVEFKPVPDAPDPAPSEAQRLRQMQMAAEGFSAEMVDRERPDQIYQLRLLPRPVYRYKSPDRGVTDGAIFVFVHATDPQVWLMIEARRRDQESQWQYAVAQMDSVRMRAFHRGREIWTAPQVTPPWSNVQDRRAPYTAFNNVQ